MIGLMTVEVQECPKNSVIGGVALAAIIERRLSCFEGLKKAMLFAQVSLAEVDRRGDGRNYPTRYRTFRETVEIYHPDFGQEVGSDQGMLEGRIERWLKLRGLEGREVVEWFEANLAWEHIMGGGGAGDIPEDWRKFLRANINGVEYGYPTGDCAWGWEEREEGERIEIYRLVTNWWYARAFGSCLGAEETAKLAGAATIYQINTDRRHPKNLDEGTYNKVVDEIRRRDGVHTDWKEAEHVAKMVGLSLSVAGIVYAVTRMMCSRRKEAEWDSVV